MEDLTRYFYEQEFKIRFLEAKKEAFQDLFSDIMEKGYPGDFQRMRPWGSLGDRKNDGYLKSRRCLFQVYAPNEMKSEEATSKIDEDFKGALPYWKEYFEAWVFVHNSRSGLGPHVEAKLLDLGTTFSPIKISNWGFEELRLEVMKLDESRLVALFGHVPNRRDFRNLRFDDIHKALSVIEIRLPSQGIEPIRPVPSNKLEANQLSLGAQTLITTGMTCTDRVKDFFDKWHDPTLGDRVAQMFYNKYVELRDEKIPPDTIFTELQSFAGFDVNAPPNRQVAVLALLAFFFEQCDIFERPRDKAT